jgi:FkbM family methyltransferase
MRKLNLFLKYLKELGMYHFYSYLYQRFIRRSELISVKVRGLSHKVVIRNNPNDIQIFSQIFIQKEYDITIEGDVKIIIDCGANIGLASLYFLSKFPNAKILAIEPEKKNFSILQNNLRNYKGAICINKGIWDKTANLEISDYSGGSAGFVLKESTIVSQKSISAISVGQIILQYQLFTVDILKIDIEGSEEQVFLTEPEWLNKVENIFCEIHENMKPGLTNKITSILMPFYNISMNGEYHVFKRKSNKLNPSSEVL